MKQTPIRAIRAKCIECAGSPRAATRCEKDNCPLYPYRTGRNPARAGIGGSDQRENGRFSQKRATQVVRLVRQIPSTQGNTPGFNQGDPRSKKGHL